MDTGSEVKASPHDLAAGQIIKMIKSNPDYSFSDVRKVVGQFYPRRLATGEKFDYITDRIIEEVVMPKLTDKELRTALREKKIIYGKELLHNARIDDLTGLFRRGYFLERTEEEILKNPKIKIIMMDVDKLKACNDAFKHIKGDEVLKALSSLMNEIFTDHAVFCRWGGEEFAMAIPDDVLDFEDKLDDFRRKFKLAVDVILPNNSSEFKGTLSVGVYNADFSKGNLPLGDAINFADQALYKAKVTRNAVVNWTPGLLKE